MITVSLFIELLRTRPRLIFWLAVLAQAAIWIAGAFAVLSPRRPARSPT